MPSSNPIIAMAEHALQGLLQKQFSPRWWRQELEALLTRGVKGQDIVEALDTVLIPACPTPLVEVVAKICTDLLSVLLVARQDEVIAATHCRVGDVLSDREDRLSLELAIDHFQIARSRLAPHHPHYNTVQMIEGAPQGRLAMLGVEPRVNLEVARALYKAARQNFAPTSPDYGRALMDEGAAHGWLGVLGVEPRANVEAAVALCQAARQSLAPASRDYGRALMKEGLARLWLAELGKDPLENVQAVVALSREARETFAPADRPHWHGQDDTGARHCARIRQ